VNRNQPRGVVARIRKVSVALRRRRDGSDLLARVLLVFVVFLPGNEEERLILAVVDLRNAHRPADGESVLVQSARGRGRSVGVIRKRGRVESRALQVLVTRAVEGVGPAL